MQFGHFDDARREYVITRADTPTSWSNYLGTTEFGSVITNHGGGYTFYKSAAIGRITRLRFNAVPMDQPGRYIYLRDRESGRYWSNAWQPVAPPLDQCQYSCRHGTGYSTIAFEHDDIASRTTYFVPLDATHELWQVQITNQSDRPRRLSLFTYLEFSNNWSTQQDLVNLQYSQYIARVQRQGPLLVCSINAHLPVDEQNFTNNDQRRDSFIGLTGADVVGFEGDREAFLGRYRTYANPITVEQGHCRSTASMSDNTCGVLQCDADLAPGERRDLAVVFGVGGADAGREALDQAQQPAKVEAALEALREHWHGQLGSFQCQTGDPAFDSTVNVWGAYNRLITYRWSRAASLVYNGERDGLGYRDTVQDLVSVFPAIPEDVKARLELMITGQYATGGALPVVKPFNHHPGRLATPDVAGYRSDDCLWLFEAVPAYLKETGDLGFLQRTLPYADRGEATVLGHLRQAIQFNFDRRGKHGLPCGLVADWNDCLQFGRTGESTFVAFQLRRALVVYRELCERLGHGGAEDGPDWATQRLAELDQALDAFAWDGQWFRRGTQKDGSIIGTAEAKEGRIFLNAQAWAVLSGYATGERALAAMDAVHEHLSTPWGVMVCAPPFVEARVETIRAVLMNPGNKENAGVFQHPQGWAVMAETTLGRGDRAFEYLKHYVPAYQNDQAEVREVEPYVLCQSTYSTYSAKPGRSRVSWLTGAATWTYVALTQHVLGVRPDYDGLRVQPCVPRHWKQCAVARVFRGGTYRIAVQNPDGVCTGVRSVSVGGESLDPAAALPVIGAGETVDVQVVLGAG